MYLILMRKNINWLKDKGILLLTLTILVFFDKIFGSTAGSRFRTKKSPVRKNLDRGVQA
jgi:hypothetical protein